MNPGRSTCSIRAGAAARAASIAVTPAASRWSTTPAASGASGPITTKSIPCVRQAASKASTSSGSRPVRLCAISAVPADLRGAGVAGAGVQMADLRAPGQPPDQGALPCSRADHQRSHAGSGKRCGWSVKERWRPRRSPGRSVRCWRTRCQRTPPAACRAVPRRSVPSPADTRADCVHRGATPVP